MFILRKILFLLRSLDCFFFFTSERANSNPQLVQNFFGLDISKPQFVQNITSNIQILIEGIALNSAMKGEYMQVLNKSTGKKIKAWVISNKKVSIFR